MNTVTERLFQRAGKKTQREDDWKGAADRSFRFHKKEFKKKGGKVSAKGFPLQSESYDCFSLADEKASLFFHSGSISTLGSAAQAKAGRTARQRNNKRKLMNTDRRKRGVERSTYRRAKEERLLSSYPSARFLRIGQGHYGTDRRPNKLEYCMFFATFTLQVFAIFC